MGTLETTSVSHGDQSRASRDHSEATLDPSSEPAEQSNYLQRVSRRMEKAYIPSPNTDFSQHFDHLRSAPLRGPPLDRHRSLRVGSLVEVLVTRQEDAQATEAWHGWGCPMDRRNHSVAARPRDAIRSLQPSTARRARPCLILNRRSKAVPAPLADGRTIGWVLGKNRL